MQPANLFNSTNLSISKEIYNIFFLKKKKIQLAQRFYNTKILLLNLMSHHNKVLGQFCHKQLQTI